MRFSISVAFLAISIYSAPSPQGLGVAYKFNNPDFNTSPQSISIANDQPENTQVVNNEVSASPNPQEKPGSNLNFIGFDRSPSFTAPEGANDNNQQGIMSFDSEPEQVDVEQFRV